MKGWKRTITLQVSAEKAFAFITNPANTPQWISTLTQETSNAFPPVLGTSYKNTSDDTTWDEYKVIECAAPTLFTLKHATNSYHVRYSITSLSPAACRLMYHEWVTEGELEHPFQLSFLLRLKELVEHHE